MASKSAQRARVRAGLFILAGIAGIFAAVFLGVAWYYSGEIHSGALVVDHKPNEFDLGVLDYRLRRVDLGPDADPGTALEQSLLLATRPGASDNPELTKNNAVGLEFEGGYAQLGHVLERTPTGVRR